MRFRWKKFSKRIELQNRDNLLQSADVHPEPMQILKKEFSVKDFEAKSEGTFNCFHNKYK